MKKILPAIILSLAVSSSNLLAIQKQTKMEEEIRKVLELERKVKKKIMKTPTEALDRFVEISKKNGE